jgi:hypothetical protein
MSPIRLGKVMRVPVSMARVSMSVLAFVMMVIHRGREERKDEGKRGAGGAGSTHTYSES